jgi:hypothetical protein
MRNICLIWMSSYCNTLHILEIYIHNKYIVLFIKRWHRIPTSQKNIWWQNWTQPKLTYPSIGKDKTTKLGIQKRQILGYTPVYTRIHEFHSMKKRVCTVLHQNCTIAAYLQKISKFCKFCINTRTLSFVQTPHCQELLVQNSISLG